MGLQKFELQITLTKNQLVSLLLTGATVGTISSDGELELLALHGCLDYSRYGDPATPMGSDHYFITYITYQGRPARARVRLRSTRSSGKDDQYVGTISFTITQSNMCD